ncbi:LAQU0S42e00166g1_1 [Lachancea quebecensis]|uniref:L-serine ammonia-lyase n=1 Tax=Lachancea quebecensis TaxID=1654605 RepID=A0A0P1KYT2_9SACH|nr:LAQU0S42e00166g1_1 [Lachancea quebecensis]
MTDSFYEKTPLLPSLLNNKQISPQIYIKYEGLQPGKSFKSRGIGYLINEWYKNAPEKKDGKFAVFSSSGGNAGLAAATACQYMGLKCNVAVPKTTKKRMIRKIEDAGATVVIHGDHWGHADSFLREEWMPSEAQQGINTLYVHPFDNETIWKGHSTIVNEIVQQLKGKKIPLERLRGVVCSVGGGGLFSGIIIGLQRHGLVDKIPVIAVETEGCDVLNKSLINGSPIRLEKLTSVATSLGSPYIASFAFDSARHYNTKSVVLKDDDVLQTCMRFADDTGFIVEPACGASLHFCYHPGILEKALGCELGEEDVIVVIACGGACVTYNDLVSAQQKPVEKFARNPNKST